MSDLTTSTPSQPTTASPATASSDYSLRLALTAVRVAAENRGQEIVLLDLRELTSVFDYFVIVTGTSRRQLHAISEEIDRAVEVELADYRLGLEGYNESRWILLDYGSVVIHLFDQEARQYYDLENLWGHARRVDISSVLATV